MIYTDLILIRHGATDWTEQFRYQGQTDIPLNAKGRAQARLLAKRLKKAGIQVVYSSALKRAKQTAEIVRSKGIRVIADPRLNELRFGVWEGKTAVELQKAQEPSFMKWSKGRWTTPKGGEPLASLKKRAGNFLRDVLQKQKGKTVGIISHGGAIKMIFLLAARIPFAYGLFHIQPGSVSALRFYGKRPQILCLNDVSHLKGRPAWEK